MSGSSATTPGQWQLPASRIVAIAFTSGSTGVPAAHPKTWGSLFHNSRLAAAEVLGGGEPHRWSPPFRHNTCTGSKPHCSAR